MVQQQIVEMCLFLLLNSHILYIVFTVSFDVILHFLFYASLLSFIFSHTMFKYLVRENLLDCHRQNMCRIISQSKDSDLLSLETLWAFSTSWPLRASQARDPIHSSGTRRTRYPRRTLHEAQRQLCISGSCEDERYCAADGAYSM